MPHNPIICAIDTADKSQAKSLIARLAPHVGHVKLGLEFFTRFGAEGVRETAGDAPLFLDLKFHDIPNTVAGAVRSATHTGCDLLTIHASGGSAMCRAAQDAAQEEAAKLGTPTPTLLAVTILTSLDNAAIAEIGYQGDTQSQVLRLAELALNAGVPGLVCSPHEIAPIRKRFGNAPILVTPGIRPDGSNKDDQKRTMTPREALDLGATHLVIGRPITGAPDPTHAAQDILASL